MQFIPARWFRPGRTKPIRLIVIHCTVSGESGTGAEAVAAYFARGERRASAHRTADNNSTVMSVKDEDTAFAAAGANSDGIHLELVGMPDQSAAQWLDAFSEAMLHEAGGTVREWSREYGIPLRWLTVAEVRDGKTKGLCTHADVSLAFPNVSTGHYDPGPHFPKAKALEIWSPQTDPEDIDMLIITCTGRPARFLCSMGVPTIDGATVTRLKAAGVKVVDFEPDDHDELLKHAEESLGRRIVDAIKAG